MAENPNTPKTTEEVVLQVVQSVEEIRTIVTEIRAFIVRAEPLLLMAESFKFKLPWGKK